MFKETEDNSAEFGLTEFDLQPNYENDDENDNSNDENSVNDEHLCWWLWDTRQVNHLLVYNVESKTCYLTKRIWTNLLCDTNVDFDQNEVIEWIAKLFPMNLIKSLIVIIGWWKVLLA